MLEILMLGFFIKMKLMSEKYAKDAENLRQLNEKQMAEQEKRLNNMAEANLQKMRTENAQQLSNLKANFASQEQQLRANNARTQQEIQAKQNEIAQLRQHINNMSQSSGKLTVISVCLYYRVVECSIYNMWIK